MVWIFPNITGTIKKCAKKKLKGKDGPPLWKLIMGPVLEKQLQELGIDPEEGMAWYRSSLDDNLDFNPKKAQNSPFYKEKYLILIFNIFKYNSNQVN